MLKITSAHEDHDIARIVIQADYRALKIFRGRLVGHGAVCFCFAESGRVLGVSVVIVIGMLFNPVEVCANGILGNLLEIDIDGGTNAKTFVHRAVPSDCSDHLLADVIDRVGLSLSVLPAPDNDFFRSRLGGLFATDKVEIAHPIESVIARFV